MGYKLFSTFQATPSTLGEVKPVFYLDLAGPSHKCLWRFEGQVASSVSHDSDLQCVVEVEFEIAKPISYSALAPLAISVMRDAIREAEEEPGGWAAMKWSVYAKPRHSHV